MEAMVFAAGLGTRLRPLTDSLPKALVPVDGRTLLEMVLLKLKAAGIGKVVVNIYHFADMISEYLAENGNFGMDIRLSDERPFLRDTGGGILYAKPLLCGEPDAAAGGGEQLPEKILVHNVDIISNLNLSAFIEESPSDALATVVVSERKTKRYLLFDEAMRLVGWTNVETGEVRSPYGEIDPGKCRRLAFSGIHLLSGRIFDAFTALGFSGKFSIIDFYLKACRDYPIYGYVPENYLMMDVGKIETLSEAEGFVRTFLPDGTVSS